MRRSRGLSTPSGYLFTFNRFSFVRRACGVRLRLLGVERPTLVRSFGWFVGCVSGCVVSVGVLWVCCVLGARCAGLCGVLRGGVALGPVRAVFGRVRGCSVRVGVVGVRFGCLVVAPVLCGVLRRCVFARCGVWVLFAVYLVAFCLLFWSR